MKTKFVLVLLFLSLPALDCSKKESVNVPSTSPSATNSTTLVKDTGIFGSWIWRSSIGGISGHQVLTPASEGYNVTIVFGTDSTFQSFRNDTLQSTTRFSISHRKDTFTDDTMDVITYQSPRSISQAIFVLSTDSLELRDECYDCMGHSYIRAK
jgi:hypothetical protein